ncbi:MAG: response regulator transcription factor [bacterium]
MKKEISIILVDDHKMVREGLMSLIEKQTDMKVVAEASSGAMAIEQSKKHKADVVVMDISMPDMSGIEATKEIIKNCPKTKVLILSMHSDRRFVTEALNIGALGYVLKDSASEELLFAIRKVYGGNIFLSTKITEVVVKDYLATRSVLSTREREVLKHIAEGMATKEIASELGLSAKTVEAHRHQIMEKLQLHSIAELTKYAIREGITNA